MEILLGIIAIVLIYLFVKIIKAIKKYAKIILPMMYITGTVAAEYYFCGTLSYIPIGIGLWIFGIIVVKVMHLDAEKLIKFNLLLVIAAIISLFFEYKYIAPLFVLVFICIKVFSGVSSINRAVNVTFRQKGFISDSDLRKSIYKAEQSCWIEEKNGMTISDYAWKRYCGLADNAIYNIIKNASEKRKRIVLFSELPNAYAYMNSFSPQRHYGDYIQDDMNIWNEGFISQEAYTNMWNIINQAVTVIVPDIDCKDTEQIICFCGNPVSSFFPSGWNNGFSYMCTLFDANLTPFVQNGTLSKIPPIKENAFPVYEVKPPIGSPPITLQPPNQEGITLTVFDDDEEEE